MSLKVPGIHSRAPSPTFSRPHSRSSPKSMNEVRARGRKRSNTVDFGFLSPDFTNIKIAQIQKQFPSDTLYLNESLDAHYFLLGRALSTQRRSAPQIVISKLQEKLIKSSSNLSAETTQSRSAKSPTSDDLSPSTCRSFIHEGAVHLSTGVSSLNRYMFLFTDLVLIAKPKSNASYKLKSRLPVSELWLRENIEGVTEGTVAAEKSFVIGWPTVSYVATFSSSDEKSLWWNVLKKTIDEQRSTEAGKTVAIRILNREEDQKNKTPLSLPVTNEDDVKTVVKMALDGFDIHNADPSDYQLWVVSGKESAAYPLIGHEIPFCIKMNHVRQSSVNSNIANTPLLENELIFEPVSPKSKCEFILKKKKAIRPRLELDSPNAQKRWRSPMKSPIINWALHKRPTKQGQLESTPQGCLFGLPITQIAVDNENLPQPIQDMLVELFRRGPSTVGIFRKSALMKSVKQLRQDLDEGKTVNFQDKSPVVIATVLKEFLRVLPSCAFGSDFPNELSSIKEITDVTERVKEIEKHINKLPKISQTLVKKFFCCLYHIARYSNTNNMTSQNLAICIAPSLLWTTKVLKATSPIETVSACEIVQFIIDNFQEIFGEDAATILGSESDIQPPLSYDDEESSDVSIELPNLESPENKCDTVEKIGSKTLNLLLPEVNINSLSNSTTPEFDRRTISPKLENRKTTKPAGNLVYGLNKQNRRHSENDLTDINDNVEHRKTRKRFPLESFTTTAELIKHEMNGHSKPKNEELSPTIITIVSYDESTTSPTGPRRKNSPLSHNLYHQKARPTPSYEEAVRTLQQNDRRTKSPQFSSRNSDDRSNSSEESIPTKLTDIYSTSGGIYSKSNSTPTTPLRGTFTNSNIGETNINMKIERQIYLQRNGVHPSYAEPFQSKKYTADELRRRSPDEVFSSSGRWRQRVAPSYEEHVQRRKRFEKAYLKEINLEKKDEQRNDSNRNLLGESLNDRAGFTQSLNNSESKKPNNNNNHNDLLSTSLDSVTLNSLRNRSNSDGRSGIPLSNGIHTFLTQRKNQDESSQDETRSPKDSLKQRGHQSVTFTHSVHPTCRTTQPSDDTDSPGNRAISPLRAAINAGSFMYCSDDLKKDAFIKSVTPNTNAKTSIGEKAPQHLSDKQKRDFTKAAEDFDKILSNLRNYDALSDDSSSSHSSISDSTCDFNIPSHEDIKNILCQDESYV